jgi:hypothetical protein
MAHSLVCFFLPFPPPFLLLRMCFVGNLQKCILSTRNYISGTNAILYYEKYVLALSKVGLAWNRSVMKGKVHNSQKYKCDFRAFATDY